MYRLIRPRMTPACIALALVLPMGASAQEEFDEALAVVEINATDGDAGFHFLLDADAWRSVRIDDPTGKKIFEESAKDALLEQGLTENFFESAEPLCTPDPEEPDEPVVSLREFLERFVAGDYLLTGRTLDNEPLEGVAELTHSLPAAPQILMFDGSAVTWTAGNDLGACNDASLVADGIIPDPMTVPLVAWEVVVEPADEEAVDFLRVFSVQLPADVTTVAVPSQFVAAYAADGVTEFKVEVGAIEASGNRTFAEREFDLGVE